jgi:hypothetical protein
MALSHQRGKSTSGSLNRSRPKIAASGQQPYAFQRPIPIEIVPIEIGLMSALDISRRCVIKLRSQRYSDGRPSVDHPSLMGALFKLQNI